MPDIMKENMDQAREKIKKRTEELAAELSVVRAGRANPSVLDKLHVDYYGTLTPVQQIASVSVPDARTLLIQPWDKSALKAVEKAVLASDIGITPVNDGSSLRLQFPPLTEERRHELVKTGRKYAEEAKIAVRNVRRDVMDVLKERKKTGELTEDDLKTGEKQLQDVTDKGCKDIDAVAAAKEKEVLEI
ncbi:MAG: ribosome recycling factor [Oscillospiraceae bacterium]|nr:ribosome recycling factor [Oscillospiraceae bacterium]